MIEHGIVNLVQSAHVTVEGFDSSSDVLVLGTEWWNGEGIDFFIKRTSNHEFNLDLSSDEIHVIAGIALRFGYLDLEEVKDIAGKIK